MSTALASARSLQGFVVLFVSASLLLVSAYYGGFGPKNGSLKDTLVSRQFFIAKPSALNVSDSHTKSIGLQFGRRGSKLNFSSSLVDPLQRRTHVKRAASEAEFQFYKRHGQVAYDEIQAALSGCGRSVQDFQPAAFANGWSRRDDKRLYDPNWEDVFAELLGEDKIPTEEQFFYVEVT